MLRNISLLILFVLLTSACATPTPPPPTAPPEPSPTPEGERAGWNLIWRDEFNSEALDLTNWTYDLGNIGSGNGEWETYTDQPENVRVENGTLIIEARDDGDTGSGYISGRIKTQGLHSWQYGRIEARIRLPHGQGIWPAFWMLGDDISAVGWPNCGEIDILEFIGKTPDTVYQNLHGPGYSGSNPIGSRFDLPAGSLLNDFHMYAIEWEADGIHWYVDDTQVFSVSSKAVPGQWVYDHPFFIILNVAVGGKWPGLPNSSTPFPQQMLVDYVRVYQRP